MLVYVDFKSALIIMILLHISACHAGINTMHTLFKASFKCFNRSKLIHLIVDGCPNCTTYDYNNPNMQIPSRIPRPEFPGTQWTCDLVEMPPGTLDRTRVKYFFGLVDTYVCAGA